MYIRRMPNAEANYEHEERERERAGAGAQGSKKNCKKNTHVEDE